MAEIISASDPRIVEYAAGLLSRGELVCYPTDTVYGVGAAASNEDAIRRLFAVKGRSLDKAMPLLIAQAGDADRIAEVPAEAIRLIEVFWPGPLTLVMRRKRGFRSLALANQDTVALRVPDETVVRDVIAAVGEPITGTSANLAGSRAPTSAAEAATQLGQMVELVIDGGARRGGQESTVLDITVAPPQVIREGAVSREELAEARGSKVL
ncbi:MAG: threonylcarbamoyl-AMP synthase [Chloroflexi bacterium]|nr:threonylcarbamoyl-AMP synthase [Chloroflexota bacterium]